MSKRNKPRRLIGDFIQRERDAAYEHVDGLHDTAVLLWRKACEAEGLPNFLSTFNRQRCH